MAIKGITIKESELRAILEEVAADLTKAFEGEQSKLLKGDDSFPPEKSSSSEESKSDPVPGSEPSKSPEKSDSIPPPPDALPPVAPAAEATPAAPVAPAADPAAPVDPAAAPVDPAAAPVDAPVTPEVLQSEYLAMGKVDPSQLDMHLKALLAAKAALGAPPASPAVSPAASPAPEATPAPTFKTEIPDSPERIDQIQKSEVAFARMMKAYEDKIADLEKSVKSQAEDTQGLTTVLQKLVERPVRKSIETLSQVETSAPQVDLSKMSRSDLDARIGKMVSSDLKKSDRELINGFYCGSVKLNELSHLFASK